MIRLICPGCQSKLNAKDELVGQSRACPKCGTVVHIVAPPLEPVAAPPAPSASETLLGGLPKVEVPERLTRSNRYLVCDRTQVVASWQNDGQGWLIRGDRGFVNAFRNTDKIPNQGDFKLVELQMTSEGERLQLRGLRIYQLAPRWALVQIARGDDAILKVVVGPGSLFRDQKNAVRQQIRELFNFEVWEDVHALREFLSNNDFHSSVVVERAGQS